MEEYIKLALCTEAKSLDKCSLRVYDPKMLRLLHAAMGFTTESGEFMDALKRAIYYGKPVDATNLVEELGDIFWYLAIAADTLGISFAEIQRRNIAKLRVRYPEKFTELDAIQRDLPTERSAVEWPEDRIS